MITTILTWAFAAITLVLLTVDILLIAKMINRKNNYIRCVGTVTKINRQQARGSDGNKTYIYPTVSYTVNGNQYEFQGNYGSKNMTTGDNVLILYHKNDPSRATMQKALPFAVKIISLLLIIFFCVTLYLFLCEV